jgi:hypothetical protein
MYFNMTCDWHMNMCCLIMLYVEYWHCSRNCEERNICQCKRREWKDAFVFNMWKQISSWYYAWHSISYLLLFCFINLKLYEFVRLFTIIKYVKIICIKGKKEKMWKHVMILVMIEWQLCILNKKTRMKVDCRSKRLKLCRIMFILHKLWCLMDHFLSWIFFNV